MISDFASIVFVNDHKHQQAVRIVNGDRNIGFPSCAANDIVDVFIGSCRPHAYGQSLVRMLLLPPLTDRNDLQERSGNHIVA